MHPWTRPGRRAAGLPHLTIATHDGEKEHPGTYGGAANADRVSGVLDVRATAFVHPVTGRHQLLFDHAPGVATMTPDLSGWAQAGDRLRLGGRPDGVITFADLADPDALRRVGVEVRGGLGLTGAREAHVTVLHYSLHAVGNALIAPAVLDTAGLAPGPAEIGILLDTRGDLAGFWLGAADPVACDDPIAHAGSTAMRLLGPVADTTRQIASIGRRAVTNIVLDSLVGSLEWFARSLPGGPPRGLVPTFLAGAGHRDHEPGRPLATRPDAGPPVVLRIKRTCCVLASEVSSGSCPTCPRHESDAVRRERVVEWLRDLDDDDFRSVTGRPRIG